MIAKAFDDAWAKLKGDGRSGQPALASSLTALFPEGLILDALDLELQPLAKVAPVPLTRRQKPARKSIAP